MTLHPREPCMKKPSVPRWLQIIAAIYLAYLALVLLVATPLLNIYAPKIYRQQTGAELTLGKTLWLNPFTLHASVRQASSVNADRSPFWSFDELSADISLASLWRGHLVLDALALRGLDVQVTQTAPARFNFSDILDYRAQHFPAPTGNTNTAPASAPLDIEIAQLDFTAKHLGLRAPHLAQPVDATIGDVSFALTDFSTVAPATPSTTTPLPHARGTQLAFAIKRVDIQFLRKQYPFAAKLSDIALTIPTLSTDAKTDYALSLRDGGSGTLKIDGSTVIAQSSASGQVQLRSISVLPAWQYLADRLAFDMKDAQLDGDINYSVSWAPTLRYQLHNSALALRDVAMQARGDSDSRVGLAALRLQRIDVDSATPRAQIGNVLIDKLSLAGWNKDAQVSLVDMFAFASDTAPSESPPWQIQVDDIAVQNSAVHWRASQIAHLPLTLAPLDIHATHLHWPDAAPLQLDLKTTLNNTAQLALQGDVTPSTQSGELQADVRNLPLAWGDVFVRQQMRATLTGGALNARAKIKLANAQPVSILSDGNIDQFELQALPDKRKLAAWQQLAWQQLALAPAQQQLSIKQIAVKQPWAQFRINADGTNNFQQLMTQTAASSAKSAAKPPAAIPAPTAHTPQADKENAGKPWQFAIDTIHINRANIDFRDASLNSAFRTNITDLSGDITGINSAGRKSAKVDLKGTVDGYAPVALTGTVNPFAATPTLNVALDMTNIDLAMLTPYAGTYAGYQIDGGRLSVQLAYTLENNRIKGSNHIVVNQMQLGKQVSGPKVMDLPLRLAIYLLTDANGVMDLGVDVTGNVDEPDFSVGSIIWKAFRNLIVKTVTSPFRALASLIGSGSENLDHIEFQSGSHELAAGESEKLQAVNKALQKKPELKLHITGHVAPIRDLEALRDNALSAQLIAQGGISANDIQQQSKNWQREVVKLFKQRFPDEKSEQWQVMQMNDAMRDNIELPASALQELAAQRALTIKQALVADLGLAADRAFVKPSDLGADKDPGPFATMTVE